MISPAFYQITITIGIMTITIINNTICNDHHRDCCKTGGELVKAGDVPGDGEDHHRHNVDAARESVHPGLHKYQDLKAHLAGLKKTRNDEVPVPVVNDRYEPLSSYRHRRPVE